MIEEFNGDKNDISNVAKFALNLDFKFCFRSETALKQLKLSCLSAHFRVTVIMTFFFRQLKLSCFANREKIIINLPK